MLPPPLLAPPLQHVRGPNSMRCLCKKLSQWLKTAWEVQYVSGQISRHSDEPLDCRYMVQIGHLDNCCHLALEGSSNLDLKGGAQHMELLRAVDYDDWKEIATQPAQPTQPANITARSGFFLPDEARVPNCSNSPNLQRGEWNLLKKNVYL